MKKLFNGSIKQSVKEYWRHLMESTKNNKISRGAANIALCISKPLKDAWRRKEEKKKPQQ